MIKDTLLAVAETELGIPVGFNLIPSVWRK